MFASHAPRKGSQGKPKDGEPDERPGCVKVLFAYTPSYEGELELAVGDIIEEVVEHTTGWWSGRLHDKVGVFPANFVKRLYSFNISVRAEWTYTASPDPLPFPELVFNKGDMFLVDDKDISSNGQWWHGLMITDKGLKSGWFPSSYVKEVNLGLKGLDPTKSLAIINASNKAAVSQTQQPQSHQHHQPPQHQQPPPVDAKPRTSGPTSKPSGGSGRPPSTHHGEPTPVASTTRHSGKQAEPSPPIVTLREPMTEGALGYIDIYIIGGENLNAKGKEATRVHIGMLEGTARKLRRICKTKKVREGPNPKWNDRFQLNVDDLLNCELSFAVRHLRKSIGLISLHVHENITGPYTDTEKLNGKFFPLKGKNAQGGLRAVIQYHSYFSEPSNFRDVTSGEDAAVNWNKVLRVAGLNPLKLSDPKAALVVQEGLNLYNQRKQTDNTGGRHSSGPKTANKEVTPPLSSPPPLPPGRPQQPKNPLRGSGPRQSEHPGSNPRTALGPPPPRPRNPPPSRPNESLSVPTTEPVSTPIEEEPLPSTTTTTAPTSTRGGGRRPLPALPARTTNVLKLSGPKRSPPALPPRPREPAPPVRAPDYAPPNPPVFIEEAPLPQPPPQQQEEDVEEQEVVVLDDTDYSEHEHEEQSQSNKALSFADLLKQQREKIQTKEKQDVREANRVLENVETEEDAQDLSEMFKRVLRDKFAQLRGSDDGSSSDEDAAEIARDEAEWDYSIGRESD